jgi:type I restriction enzyme, S subunit
MNNFFIKKKWKDVCTLEYGESVRDYKNKNNDFDVYGSSGRIGSYNKYHLKEGVIVSRKGTLDVHYSETPFFVIDTAFYLKPKNEISARWAYYALKNLNIKNLTSGTGVPSLSRESLYEEELLLPPLHYQKLVESFLIPFDKNIKLNYRMNEVLEKILDTIYISWFENFDPVKKKIDASFNKLKKEISSLFPDNFENSNLGQIPKGWQCLRVSDVMEFVYGSALTKNNRKYGTIPVYGSNGIVGFHNISNSKGPGIVVGRAGNPGTVHWSNEDFFAIDSAFSVKIKNSDKSYFYYHVLKKLDLPRFNSGSAIPGLNRNDAYAEKFIRPSLQLIEKFNELSIVIKDKIENNFKEIDILKKIRNNILSKLILGQILIEDKKISQCQ